MSKAFDIPSVRRDTVREHLFGIFEPRRVERLRVLDNVSLHVHRGDTLGIMGRNGSGKSTLLKSCAASIPPTPAKSGPCRHHTNPGARRRMESRARRDRQCVSDRLGHGSVACGHPSQSRHILAFAELERFAKLPLKHYSSGMASRLAYAVAFRAVREVLVLDEIFAVGDAGFRAKCEERYKDLRAAGHTMVLVSHEPRVIGRSATVPSCWHKGAWRSSGRNRGGDAVRQRLLPQ